MYETELAVALDAVRQAGLYLLQAYAQFQTIAEAPADITTEADRRSQEIILSNFAHFPKDSYCAEEATETLCTAAQGGPRHVDRRSDRRHARLARKMANSR